MTDTTHSNHRSNAPTVHMPSIPYASSHAEEILRLAPVSDAQLSCAIGDILKHLAVDLFKIVSVHALKKASPQVDANSNVHLLVLHTIVSSASNVQEFVSAYNTHYQLYGARIHADSSIDTSIGASIDSGALFFSFVFEAPNFNTIVSRLIDTLLAHKRFFTSKGISLICGTRTLLHVPLDIDLSQEVVDVFRSDSSLSSASAESRDTLVASAFEGNSAFEASVDDSEHSSVDGSVMSYRNDFAGHEANADAIVHDAQSATTEEFTGDRNLADFVADQIVEQASEHEAVTVHSPAAVTIPASVTVAENENMTTGIHLHDVSSDSASFFVSELHESFSDLNLPDLPDLHEAAVVSEAVVIEAIVSEAVVSEAIVSEAAVPEAAVPEVVVPEAAVPEAAVPHDVSVTKKRRGRPPYKHLARVNADAVKVPAPNQENDQKHPKRPCVIANSLLASIPNIRGMQEIAPDRIAELYKSALHQRLLNYVPLADVSPYNNVRDEWISANKSYVIFAEFKIIMSKVIPSFQFWESIERFDEEPAVLESSTIDAYGTFDI